MWQQYPDWKAKAQFEPATRPVAQQRQWFAEQIGIPPRYRFQEEQFDLYKRVWLSLKALKDLGDQLWEEASETNLLRLSDQLVNTYEMIEENALLFGENEYHTLRNLLERLNDYIVGKRTVIQIRRRGDFQQYATRLQYEGVETQVELNRLLKQEYEQVLDIVRSSFHNALSPKA
jgi:hypothetical protein